MAIAVARVMVVARGQARRRAEAGGELGEMVMRGPLRLRLIHPENALTP